MQPADLGPVLHGQQLPSLLSARLSRESMSKGVKIRPTLRGQFSTGADKPSLRRFRDGRRATSSTTGVGTTSSGSTSGGWVPAFLAEVSRRSQSDLLNHRCRHDLLRLDQRRLGPSLPCGGFETVAERPPQPPVSARPPQARPAEVGSQPSLRRFRDGRRATSSTTGVGRGGREAADEPDHPPVRARRRLDGTALRGGVARDAKAGRGADAVRNHDASHPRRGNACRPGRPRPQGRPR